MFAQVLINAVITSCTVALVAVGFSLVFRVCKFFDFSFGLVYTFGAYSALFGYRLFESNGVVLVLIGGCGGAALGACLDLGIYRRVRLIRGDSLSMLLVSLGAYVVGVNLLGLLFGDETRSIRKSDIEVGINVFGGRITELQIGTLIVVVFFLSLLWWISGRNRMGLAIRCVAENEILATYSVMYVERIRLFGVFIASFLGGLSGALAALDTDMTPMMGMRVLLLAIVSSVIGGFRSVPGIVVGAVIVGFGHQLTGFILGTEWQDAVLFLVLVGALIIRPKGIRLELAT